MGRRTDRREHAGSPPLAGRERFEAMVEAHADEVFGFFARRVRRDVAADLTAETFQAAWTAWDRFEPDRSTRAWLFGIARNVLGHRFRRDGREERALGRVAMATEPAWFVEAVDDRLDAGRAWQGVSAGLAALSPADREVLLLVAWEDLSYAEIASVTDVPIGTVRSRLNRARRQVREHLERAQGTQPPTGAGGDDPKGNRGLDGDRGMTMWVKETRP